MRAIRVGLLGRSTTATDGGADTLLTLLREHLARGGLGAGIELVDVPWSAWSHRRRPLRYAWCRVVRAFGGELPLVDLRPVCRRYRLDAAWFMAPAYAHIDIPFIYSAWDVGHRTIPSFPEMRSGRDPWTMREAQYRRMLGQASRVLTGNEAGAAELRELFGVANDQLVIVPFPNPDFSAEASEAPAWLPAGPYFLFPAQFWPHKNHYTLLQALARLNAGGGRAATLVFVGSEKGNSGYLKGVARELGILEHVLFAGFVRRAELKALYERATGLVFASLLGPNNLPPQEAAVLGCPMILSDLVGHREQMRDGALYASPLEAGAWAEAMRQLVDDDTLRRTLVERARAVVANHTPERYLGMVARSIEHLAAVRRLWP